MRIIDKKLEKKLKLIYKGGITMFLLTVMCLLIVSLLFKLLCPLFVNIGNMFFSLLQLYMLVDINTKFIGGIFFLFLYWKVFEVIYIWFIKLVKYVIWFTQEKVINVRGKKK